MTVIDKASKILAIIFLFLLVVGSSAVIAIEILRNEGLNPYAIAIVSSGISYSLILLGIHLGNGNTTGAST